MKTWIALLKGVNVGGNNKLPMKELKLALEKHDFQQVQTYIQSGNIVFQHQQPDQQKLSNQISAIIEAEFGFKPSVIVLSKQELATVINNQPFTDLSIEQDAKVLHFFFFNTKPETINQVRLSALLDATERWQLVGNVLYFHTPNGFGKSKLGSKVDSVFGATCTARNWTSVCAIYSLT